MIPRIAEGGRSFKGAFRYYMHDPEENTRDRIAWTHTHNMLTRDPDKAWKVMAYTAKVQDRLKQASGQKMTGRKTEKPVMVYSLSWHPELDPDKDHMLGAAMRSINALGLQDHEAIIIAHRDTPHRHVHVVVNRVHPITGLVASDSHTKRKLSEFALQFQKEHNMDYCPQREENHRKREEGEKTRYRDPGIQAAWSQSDSGQGFIAALEERGYRLARGNKRLVVIDPYGRAQNPVRHIEGMRAKTFHAKLRDIAIDRLPEATAMANEIEARREKTKAPPAPQAVSPGEDFAVAAPPLQPHAQPADMAPDTDAPAARTLSPEQAAKILNRLQDRHLKQRADLSDHFHRRIQHESIELDAYYDLSEQRRAISRLEDKCASPPFWRRLLGLARRDKEELLSLQRSYQNSMMRYGERIGTIEASYAARLADLAARQERERAQACEILSEGAPVARITRSHESYTRKRGPGPSRGPG